MAIVSTEDRQAEVRGPEPRPGEKPQPIGNAPFIFLFTTAAFCVLFLIWRRAHALRKVVSVKYVPRYIRRDCALISL